jgi:integration host factor subunit beta
MIKSELITRVSAQNPHLSRNHIEKIVDSILGDIEAAMTRGDRVELRGFGTFTVRQRSARTGRNPKTGIGVAVNRKNFPYFRTGKEMRIRLNKPQLAQAPDQL